MLKSGYYWVKYHGEWMPAEWSDSLGCWSLCGYDGPIEVVELEDVGDRLEHA